MTAAEARARAKAHPDWNIFISYTDEEGDGPAVAVKDLVHVKGTVTTGGGKVFPATVDAQDDPVIARLRKHGCVMIGKLNMHEFAYGLTSINPHYGTVHNPKAPGRVAGGSSGGSAAAVAADMCDWAIGTDTGGSIRNPAAMCGVTGFKPTVGTVDTAGVIPLSKTLDTLGPLAHDVIQAAGALAMMCDVPGLVPAAPRPLSAFRLAVPAPGWVGELDSDVSTVWQRVSAGLPVIDLPERLRMANVSLTIMYREAYDYHRPWIESDSSRYGADVLATLMRGKDVTQSDYERAQAELLAVRRETEAAMADYDAMLVPATAIAPPLVTASSLEMREPLSRFTRPFNVTGQPVYALPYPTTGLPVGIQVVGHFGRDAALVPVAWALERAWTGKTQP
ncbi:amidase [bacterium]|nr:MAG: amidase [bacterium]